MSVVSGLLGSTKIKGSNQENGEYNVCLAANQNSVVHLIQENSTLLWDGSSLILPHLGEVKTSEEATVGNLAAIEVNVKGETQLEVLFNNSAAKPWSKRASFLRKFSKIFKRIPSGMKDVTRFALSNLLGSISYFYGTSFVLHSFEETVSETEPFELFTDIPSRATFPRGFLWDSGFHNLAIAEWDVALSLDILESWSKRIEPSGWVAREQVPGEEARRAVPVDYIVQNTQHANPPAMLLSLLKIARFANKMEDQDKIIRLKKITHHFERNLRWLIRTQRGIVHPQFCSKLKRSSTCPNILRLPVFRWRGRSQYHNLNSGLDDYPRGAFPNRYELHLDLACWVAFGVTAIRQLHTLLGIEGDLKERKQLDSIYKDVRSSLDLLHWDQQRKIYSDTTIGDDGSLVYTDHQGYVNLFPLIFGFIDKNSPKLKASLDLIEDEARLWTPYGLRSLSKSDTFYMKGDQYWTGPVWLNLNYLVLSSLHNVLISPFLIKSFIFRTTWIQKESTITKSTVFTLVSAVT